MKKTVFLNTLIYTIALQTAFSVQAGPPFSTWDDAVHYLMEEYGIHPEENNILAVQQESANQQQPKKQSKKTKQSRKKKCCKGLDTLKNQRFSDERLENLNAAVQNIVNSGAAVGAYAIGTAGKEAYSFYAGFQSAPIDPNNLPPAFTGDTIIRLASMSKFLGTVGFLKLIDKGLITGFEPLSDFIPEFANTKVMQEYTPTASVSLNNTIRATAGSTTLTIEQMNHKRCSGQLVGIENALAVQGIPASEINALHTITVTGPNAYTIEVATPAEGTSSMGEGGCVMVKTLECGVKRTELGCTVYYYQEVPLDRPILLYHVLTHSLGYSYWSASLNLTFGYAANPTLRNTQGGIYNALQLPMAAPDPALPLSSGTIKEWAPALAEVPLLFQPGTEWCYGPSLSILGALIELIDPEQRDLRTYMQEEVFKPLCMKDTGFFIQNDDPNREDKLARIMTLYIGGTTIPVAAIPPIAYTEDYFYGEEQPRTLALIDAGIYSTPNDFQKFMNMLLNDGYAQSGESILSPAMLCWLSDNHTLNNSVYNILDLEPNVLTPGKWPKWGLGVAVTAGATMGGFGGVPLVSCSGRAIYWSGFLGTIFYTDFTNDTTVQIGVQVLGTGATQNFRQKGLADHYAALMCINPNNENTSSNNPSSSSNPT